MKRMNVFISHATADKELASKIAIELKSHGLAVSHPDVDMALGENMALRVGKALEQADAVVVLLSPESTQSEWVRHEIGYALTNPRFQGRLVPVMAKKTERIPWILRDLNILRLPSDSSDLARRIVQRIRPVPANTGVRFRRTASRPALMRA